MVDPLSTFGAAVNILQCIEVGSKLIREAAEYSACGGSHEHDTLRRMTQQLVVSNSHLQTYLEAHGPSNPAPGPNYALYLANQECLRVSKDFLNLLEELKLTGYVSTWKSGTFDPYSISLLVEWLFLLLSVSRSYNTNPCMLDCIVLNRDSE